MPSPSSRGWSRLVSCTPLRTSSAGMPTSCPRRPAQRPLSRRSTPTPGLRLRRPGPRGPRRGPWLGAGSRRPRPGCGRGAGRPPRQVPDRGQRRACQGRAGHGVEDEVVGGDDHGQHHEHGQQRAQPAHPSPPRRRRDGDAGEQVPPDVQARHRGVLVGEAVEHGRGKCFLGVVWDGGCLVTVVGVDGASRVVWEREIGRIGLMLVTRPSCRRLMWVGRYCEDCARLLVSCL
jgi:hypothetical protein